MLWHFAEILLANVTRTHREVVRRFSRQYAALALPGAQQMTPTVAQVMNALLAEEDLDEKVGEEMPRASVNSAKKTTNSQGKQSNGNSGNGSAGNGNAGNGNAGEGKKQRGRGRYKQRARTPLANLVVVRRMAAAGIVVSWITSAHTVQSRRRPTARRTRSSTLAWKPSVSKIRRG